MDERNYPTGRRFGVGEVDASEHRGELGEDSRGGAVGVEQMKHAGKIAAVLVEAAQGPNDGATGGRVAGKQVHPLEGVTHIESGSGCGRAAGQDVVPRRPVGQSLSKLVPAKRV